MNLNDRAATPLAALEDHAGFVARHIGTTPAEQAAMLARARLRVARRADGRDRSAVDPPRRPLALPAVGDAKPRHWRRSKRRHRATAC